jgi:hypothetical protein
MTARPEAQGMFGLYDPLLLAHSWTRWIVLGGAVVLGSRAVVQLRSHSAWEGSDNYLMWVFNWAISFQVLFGLSLYLFLSPMVRAAYRMGADAMHNPVLRFWMVEHPFAMLGAWLYYQIMYRRVRKTPADRKYRAMAIAFSGVVLCLCLGIPWPGLIYGRPLVRLPVW